MKLNDDFTARTLVHAARLDWQPSPSPGVERRMIFRIGEEKARATSIVRYAPGSRFSQHMHPGGEEFLVLDGVFEDEHGAYPAGSYVRNPPGSHHSPASGPGCSIFVRLWQFREDDREQVVVPPGSSGVLFENPHEQVRIEEWTAGEVRQLDNPRGLELLVLAGGFSDGRDRLEALSWLRLPAGMPLRAQAGPDGARVWLKDAALQQRDASERLAE
ncbi:anti-sigma factor, putative, ChrR family [compost metagenome]